MSLVYSITCICLACLVFRTPSQRAKYVQLRHGQPIHNLKHKLCLGVVLCVLLHTVHMYLSVYVAVFAFVFDCKRNDLAVVKQWDGPQLCAC